MKLSVAKYLKVSNCQDASVRYAWDDWKSLPELKSPNEELFARLKGLSQRAVLAFACGTAEWPIYRFERLCDTTLPWNLIQTAWAMIVHLRYGLGPESWSYHSAKGWEGPIKRPIWKTLMMLEAAFYPEYHTDPPSKAAKISALTCYVMSDPAPYNEWCEQVLKRFEALYPRDPEDELGDAVPRQAVDPDYHFKIEQTEYLIQNYLAGLDCDSNIFLSSSEEMLEDFGDALTFTGTPYVFDIERDRKVRLER